LFQRFQKYFPPTAVVIHMPEKFTYTFAERLNEICYATVKEAEHNEKALPGHIYVAPGNYHLVIKASGQDYMLKVVNAPKIHNQRPSVDVLFNSVAENAGKNSIGILLTGMGRDGAEGLLEMKKRGAFTVAQDKSSSLVFGMPKSAIDLGAADLVLPLEKIVETIQDKGHI
jgi:two-component system chemotaxis response regulator CheB